MRQEAVNTEAIGEYFDLIKSDDISDLEQARGMLDSILYDHGYEVHTGLVIKAFENYHGLEPDYSTMGKPTEELLTKLKRVERPPEPYSSEAQKRLERLRLMAVSHVIRGMILGGRVDEADFGQVIGSALTSASFIEGNNGSSVSRGTRKVFKQDISEAAKSPDYSSIGTRERAKKAKHIFDRSHRFGRLVLTDELETTNP